MKKKRFYSIITILALSLCSLFAQKEAIDQANKLYKAGNYEAAAMHYEDIVQKYGVSAELYYNTANAYYKTGEVGRSILNYERALRLAPNYDDAEANLELAQTKIVDNIVQVPPFFVKRWIDNIIKLLSIDQWYVLSVILLIITLSCFLFFVFGNSMIIRKITFYAAFILLAITIVTIIFTSVRHNQLMNHNEAIIMSGTVTIKSSPDKSGTDLFQLHEGTKVSIKSALDQWIEIKVGNGNIGWIEAKDIEKI
jgi:tetratricopeptide (TPR) repeat protein